jgi:hypothetical protein
MGKPYNPFAGNTVLKQIRELEKRAWRRHLDEVLRDGDEVDGKAAVNAALVEIVSKRGAKRRCGNPSPTQKGDYAEAAVGPGNKEAGLAGGICGSEAAGILAMDCSKPGRVDRASHSGAPGSGRHQEINPTTIVGLMEFC